jgi:hypothetical protein
MNLSTKMLEVGDFGIKNKDSREEQKMSIYFTTENVW